MNDEQLAAVLQRVHELTQQNSPESAGAAWLDLLQSIAELGGRFSHRNQNDIIEDALRRADILEGLQL